ncbi:hypothetical protein PIROE2DRAFT_8258 [Piromyces sp. E2]|nr:hypothetical protein PIROE2DRAFT_8258 [Piromyces sp. E2]|eukprot:OUM64869.1 hypothetical protein PIROE2DRAFT_8258 [Piromyces sp. E2]
MSDSDSKTTKFLKRPPRLGDVVQVKTTLQEGTVKFIGGIHFKSGTWVGIELFEHGTGKNNGTIKGVTYFKCPSQTGLLVMATSVNVLKPAQKIVTNSQKASLVSKTIYKQPKKPRKSISRPSESATPSESVDTTRKIKTLPRQTSKQTVIKVKPRPKSTQVSKSTYNTTRLDRLNKELRPAQTNININMTMTTSPKEQSIFLKNRINPNTSAVLIPKCEIDGEQLPEDSKNVNDAIINGLQNTLVHLKDIVSGLADEYYDENGQPRIKATIQQNDIVSESDLLNSQNGKEYMEGDIENKNDSRNYSSTNIPLNNNCEEGVRMSLKQVTDSQRTISELSIGLVNAQQEVRKLKDSQTNLNRALSYYKEENKSLIERVAELEKQNKSLTTLPSKERYIQELETKNKNLNIEYEQVKNELYFAKKNIDELYRKLEYNETPAKSISVYNKYSSRSESRIARHKTFAKKNTNLSNIYNKSKNIRDNVSSEFSYNSDSETKINDTLIDMKEQNEKLILENETLHEEMEMLKNTLLDIQDDRENSTNHFMEKMEYQEKKYDDLKGRYLQIEAEKNELISRIESISSLNSGELPEIPKKSNSDVDDAMIAEMKSLVADMEVTLNKTIVSEKEARSNFDAVNKLYEASKVKMEALKHELEQRKMDYQLLSESNEELTKENNELKQTIKELNQAQTENKSSSNEANEELQNQYHKLQKQYEATKEIIEDKEAEMINYEVQCNQLEGQIIDFEKQLSMKQNEIDCLIEKFQTLQTANTCRDWNDDEKNEVIQDQANKICVLEDTVKKIKDENNLLKIHNEESINEISKLSKVKNDLEVKIANKENEMKEKVQEKELQSMEKEMKEKNDQIEELTHKNNALSTEIKESNEKLLEIKNEKEKVDQELEELNKRMSKNTQELEDLTAKYEEEKKRYEKEIYEINKDRELSVQHAKEEIETIINQLSDTRKQFESKVNQLETSKQKMQKEYETEIEDLNQQLQLLANLQQQTEQAENLLELSTLLDESERAKEVAESNAENRRKLLEKVIVERDQLSQDLQSEKEKFLSLKGEYEQCKERINKLESEDLASYLDRNRSFTRDCNNCEKLKQEISRLKEEIEELSILKNIDVQGIDEALKQSTEDIQKEREEKDMLKKGYTIIWNSYLSLENECQKLLTQLNEKMGIKEETTAPSSTIRKAQSELGSIRSNFITPKDKLNTTFDSIQDYTYDFDYVSVPDSNRILNRELKEEPVTTKVSERDQDKRTSIKTNSDSHPSLYSPKQDGKEKIPFSTLSESSSNTLYSPKRRSSFSASTKYQTLPKTNPNRIKNYKSQSVIYETLENNDDTLYHKPEDEADLIDYSSILQKSRARSSTLLSNKYSYRN